MFGLMYQHKDLRIVLKRSKKKLITAADNSIVNISTKKKNNKKEIEITRKITV